uniref:Uncharacterized protein n=1 Tax=Musa acuminata subsp. malaccensis TaxID=214687 RepID=A0A804I4V0_MUSAM
MTIAATDNIALSSPTSRSGLTRSSASIFHCHRSFLTGVSVAASSLPPSTPFPNHFLGRPRNGVSKAR